MSRAGPSVACVYHWFPAHAGLEILGKKGQQMHTKIIVQHATAESLKSSPLWREIMAIAFLDDADVSVVEIAADDEAEEAATPSAARQP